jgi:predicted amidohydrolase YtcJ
MTPQESSPAVRRHRVGRRMLCIVLALTAAAGSFERAEAQTADIMLLGGRVFTADPARPWAEAVAVRGSRILAVGTIAEVERLAGPATRRIVLGGRTVVPGFDDAHAHAGPSGARGMYIVVDPSPMPDPSLDALLDSISAAARRVPAGTWLRSAIGPAVLDDPRTTRTLLDSAAPAHPVWLQGWSGHGLVLNTAGMRAAGLLDAPDPPGGWLARDAAGTPTGRVDEYALFNAERRLATAHGDSLLAASFAAYDAAGLRLGITTVQDFATQYDLATARAAAQRGAVRTRHRIIRFPNTDTPGGWQTDWSVAGADTALGPMMHISGVKWVLDGTPIERLALMRAPYADRPDWHGRANFPYDTLRMMLRAALAHGQQPMLHAVGDSMIALVIRAMRAEAPDSAWRRLRPRLEHADALARDQLDAIRSLGFIIVQNPAHLALPDVLTSRWGAERLARVNLLRSIVAAGIPLALGSDGPRAPGINVMLASLHPNVPSEALTREQAVIAYTRGSAYAAFAERERGTIAPGMLADLVVLSHDIFTAPADALPGITSVLTMIGGAVLLDELPRR